MKLKILKIKKSTEDCRYSNKENTTESQIKEEESYRQCRNAKNCNRNMSVNSVISMKLTNF